VLKKAIVIRALPARSAPGPDTISNTTFKRCGKNYTTIFCRSTTAAQNRLLYGTVKRSISFDDTKQTDDHTEQISKNLN